MSATISAFQRRLGLSLVLAAIGHAGLLAAPWLTFTEISYRPAGDEALEFVEIYNLEAPHVDLTGWKLEGEVEFEFPRGLRLAPKQCVVVARDVAAFRKRYPGVTNVVGPYRGDLDNRGGRLTLLNRVRAEAAALRYGSGGPWPAVPDGTGHSLVLADAFLDTTAPDSWRPSAMPGGTPGVYVHPLAVPPGEPLSTDTRSADSAPPGARPTPRAAPPIARLNEVALERAVDGVHLDWIEVYNPDGSPVDLGGCFLSDDPARLARWEIPAGTTVASESFTVLSRDELGARGAVGPVLYLTAPDGDRVIDALSRNGAGDPRLTGTPSFGRYPDGAERCWRLARKTHGAPNELFVARDVVINEISYHPAGDDATDEYIELHNRGTRGLTLNGLHLGGGVRYDFKAGDTIEPGGFLVVARAPGVLAERHRISPRRIVGPFEGQLSNDGEEIRLHDQLGRTVDLVAYADRPPWPEFADGRGSSLELIDPNVDNALPGAWAASDERSKSPWQLVRYQARVSVFSGMRASSFQFMLLDAGECLIDDLRVVDASGVPVIDEYFDGDATGWQAFGTHLESSVVPEGPFSRSPCCRIVATGRGNTRHNYVSLSLRRDLPENAEYTVSFRARWLGGSALLLSRTAGQGLARTHRLRLPDPRGTPGRPNSRAAIGSPVVGVPAQRPIAPRAGEWTRIDAPISARTTIRSAEVLYRHESESKWRSAPLERRNPATWTALIPPRPRGRVEFAILATDADGRVGSFPPGGTYAPALFAVGLDRTSGLPCFDVLVSDREWQASRARQRMSNRLMRATLVYGTSRIFYDVGFRLRGSGFTRGDGNWRLVFGAESLDGRKELTFDGQGRDDAQMNERATFWLLDQVDVPTPRQRYVRLSVHGPGQESGIYEEVEKVNGDFLARWFPPGDVLNPVDERLHKVDDYWDFAPPGETDRDDWDGREGRRGRRGGFGRRGGDYAEAYMSYQTSDPEDYRWNFPPRANGDDEDFGPLIELFRLLDPDVTLDVPFRARVETLVAVDEWTRVLAARTVANDWDTYGLRRGKNAYLYRAPSGRWHLLPWDSDLSWRSRGFGRFSRSASLFSDKFPAVVRLLRTPEYRRMFLGHAAFLATKRLEPKYFSRIADELSEHVGASGYQLEEAAEANRERILAEIPAVRFAVNSITRAAREGQPDVVRVSGTAPLIAAGFRLADREGTSRFATVESWTAEFEIGPERGELLLQAIDRDGDEVARATITLPE